MNKKKIMIVDDSEEMRVLVDTMLKSLGYDVIEAALGSEAIAKVAKDKPDLILMDIMMPNIGGIEATLKIKNNPQTKNIPIIMLTALLDSDAVLRSYEYGADHYLNKPFNIEQLSKAINFVEKIGTGGI